MCDHYRHFKEDVACGTPQKTTGIKCCTILQKDGYGVESPGASAINSSGVTMVTNIHPFPLPNEDNREIALNETSHLKFVKGYEAVDNRVDLLRGHLCAGVMMEDLIDTFPCTVDEGSVEFETAVKRTDTMPNHSTK